eukprot:scaffold100842_cov72-Phaeocystis_antarctica.AAC.4
MHARTPVFVRAPAVLAAVAGRGWRVLAYAYHGLLRISRLGRGRVACLRPQPLTGNLPQNATHPRCGYPRRSLGTESTMSTEMARDSS